MFMFISSRGQTSSAGVNGAEKFDIFYIFSCLLWLKKKKRKETEFSILVLVRKQLCETYKLRCLSEVGTLIYAIVTLSLSECIYP